MTKKGMINQLRDIADILEIKTDNKFEAEKLKNIADKLQIELNPIQDIVKLNEERYGLDFNSTQAYSKLYEELEEFKNADLDNNNIEMLDALADIIVIAIGEIRKMGYDPELVLNEVVDEIYSRDQDPIQCENWAMGFKEPGEKWKKNKKQDPSTLYKANFEKAKIKG